MSLRLEGTVTSGVAQYTTAGNSFRNIVIWLFYRHYTKTNFKFAVLGDDTIFAATKEHLKIMSDRLSDIFINKQIASTEIRHGLGITIESMSPPSKTAEFCSKMVRLGAGCYSTARIIDKSVANCKY